MKRLALGQIWSAEYQDNRSGNRMLGYAFKIIAIKKKCKWNHTKKRFDRYQLYLGIKLNQPDVESGACAGDLWWFDQNGHSTDGYGAGFGLMRKKKTYWAEREYVFMDETKKPQR